MTHQEIFHRIMSFQSVPRLPNYELGIWGQNIERWMKEGCPDRRYLTSEWFVGEPFFHMDRREFAWLDTGPRPLFEYKVLEETDRYLIARHVNGIVTRALKEGTVCGTRMSMDEYFDFPVKDRASWLDMKGRFDGADPSRYPPVWPTWIMQVTSWRHRDYPLCLLTNGAYGLYSQLRSWAGTEGISYMFYDDPALVEEMIEHHTEFLIKLVERALGEAVTFDYFNFFEDFAGKGGPLIGPEIFRKFFLKSYQRITSRLRQAGIKHFWLDSDGDTEVLIPLLIEAGITCHWPLEQASGMDPVRLRKKFGNAIAFAGGIDKRELAKDQKAIERELYAKIPPMRESGGFIPHVDHTIQPDVSYENFLYYMDLKRKLIS